MKKPVFSEQYVAHLREPMGFIPPEVRKYQIAKGLVVEPVSWAVYHQLMKKGALRRAVRSGALHYTNILFHRYPGEFWIEGQGEGATRVVNSSLHVGINHRVTTREKVMDRPTYGFLPYEYEVFNDAMYDKRSAAIDRYYAWKEKVDHFKKRMRGNFSCWIDRSWRHESSEKWEIAWGRENGKAVAVRLGTIKALLSKPASEFAMMFSTERKIDSAPLQLAWTIRREASASGYLVDPRVIGALDRIIPEHNEIRVPSDSKVTSLINLPAELRNNGIHIRPGSWPFLTEVAFLTRVKHDRLIAHETGRMLHVSQEDATMVAYAQSAMHIMQARWTRTTMGKYLQKFYGNVLTAEQIKTFSTKWVVGHKPLELHLIGNDRPDLWAKCYETSVNRFKSCMTMNRSDRYISNLITREKHPVKAFASGHPENHLALAWIGVAGDNGEIEDVWARAIVNTKTKTFLRAYGDTTRMSKALQQHGYGAHENRERTLIGQVLRAMFVQSNVFSLPYLDAGGYRMVGKVEGSKDVWAKVVDSDAHISSSSNGTAVFPVPHVGKCYHCGKEEEYVPRNDANVLWCMALNGTLVQERQFVCEECRPSLVPATIRAGNWAMVHADQCVPALPGSVREYVAKAAIEDRTEFEMWRDPISGENYAVGSSIMVETTGGFGRYPVSLCYNLGSDGYAPKSQCVQDFRGKRCLASDVVNCEGIAGKVAPRDILIVPEASDPSKVRRFVIGRMTREQVARFSATVADGVMSLQWHPTAYDGDNTINAAIEQGARGFAKAQCIFDSYTSYDAFQHILILRPTDQKKAA